MDKRLPAEPVIKKLKEDYSDIDEVLLGKYKLAALLSFDQKNGFYRLLQRTIIKKDDFETISKFWPEKDIEKYKQYFFEESTIRSDEEDCRSLVWNDDIPLGSIFRMAELLSVDCKSVLYPMYQAYVFYDKNRDSVFRFPEGIRKINFRFSFQWDFERTLNWQKIIFPTSIREINGAPQGCAFDALPEGLEILKLIKLYRLGNIHIRIPSSLKTIENLPDASLNLIFDRFQESTILHDKKSIMKIIEELCEPIKESYSYVTSHNWITGPTYQSSVYIKGYQMKKIMITICDSNGNPIRINLGGDEVSVHRWGSDATIVLQEFVERRANELRSTIIDKTGHDIFQDFCKKDENKVLKK